MKSSKKDKKSLSGFASLLVYSTNPQANQPEEDPSEEQSVTPPSQQAIRIRRETKHRGGKTVSVITGFDLSDNALEDLSKYLKTKCGCGGSVKEGSIIIQGEDRDKIKALLEERGFTKTKIV